MADKLLIIMANSDPDSAMSVVPPITQAAVAAAMEFEAEIIFTGHCAKLVVPGTAEKLMLADGRAAIEVIREARDAGVKIKVCASGLERWGETVIAEVEETVGAAYIISEAMDGETVTFTY
ncbi:MAG TPA: peroxiredoxin [Candidatus Tenderia sp.]|nr:peroxiredoxin [Candidatus Tenderia sp.]